MTSTFHGLEVAKRALSTQQAALYTTSHNISNANTEGYTRQRVNFEQVTTLTGSRYTEGVKSNIGKGVQAGSIQRVRDSFLDVQYRNEHGKLGYYEQRANAMDQMETIMNEPSEEGLSFAMDQFYNALQDLSVNPEDSGARSVVSQRGQAVADTFTYISNSLEQVRGDLQSQLDVTETEFNSLVDQINNVNQQIGEVEPHGHVPNNLYDERDRLIDRLSSIANVSVNYVKSSGQPSEIAEGKATITLNGTGGQEVTLVDGETREVNHVTIGYDDNNNVKTFSFSDPDDATGTPTEINAEDFTSKGELLGLVEMNGYVKNDGEVAGEYTDMLSDLDKMAVAFVNEFNRVHQNGSNIADGNSYDFFKIDETADRPAATIKVTDDILNDKNKIAASSDGSSGDGSNAIALSNVFSKRQEDYLDPTEGLGNKASVQSFYQSMIGDMGVVTQEANRMVDNATVLSQQVQENRDSVSAVSLDEEMTNMIKFQHAYNAAARSMTTVDEMLDRIINNMGLVGR
ncbi:Flagellar hook-associated protein 1 [Paraliobacillus sp. PM-2]|uniref:flagellar hook-associated protein FlgK n=1 Tax=Paraliobacillus sp. PM-2 TaxID=1462524 RepID=UPI00061CA4D4|nr:flagellar hook-associated protein FlgK [Paraliobacillus sp. PM-2]CQR46397.1 Flagellar hook-associated protein 1 [Paraliobacillus sp. PM-2]